jgi:hypothetical protein
MADGFNVPVQHPEFMAAAPSGHSLVVYQSNDSFKIINIRLITSLEVKNNGQVS